MTNNKQQTAVEWFIIECGKYGDTAQIPDEVIDEAKEMEEEKLNVAYGNGYEQGEMDFYKTMQGKGNQYADGYAEGYLRALELVKFQIVEQLEQRK
jgi:hypothetical protein